MPVPTSVEPDLGIFLQELEERIGVLENPQSPVLVPPYATADMPPAANHLNGVLRNTTLNVLAHSDGVSWIRADTGAPI